MNLKNTTKSKEKQYAVSVTVTNALNAVHPDVLFDSQGIRIIQPNTSFLLLKYTYIQGYMFRLRGTIIYVRGLMMTPRN